MAVLTVQDLSENGLTASYVAAGAGGDTFANSKGNVFLHVKNGGGSSITVTATAQSTTADNVDFGKLTKANATKSIAAGAEAYFGPFPPKAFNTGGSVSISYSAVTTVTVAAIRMNI